MIKIKRATYGVPGDAVRTRDVLANVQALVDRGELEFPVSQLAQGDDPAYGTVKTLSMEYTADGRPFTFSGQDPDTHQPERVNNFNHRNERGPGIDRRILHEYGFERHAHRGSHGLWG